MTIFGLTLQVVNLQLIQFTTVLAEPLSNDLKLRFLKNMNCGFIKQIRDKEGNWQNLFCLVKIWKRPNLLYCNQVTLLANMAMLDSQRSFLCFSSLFSFSSLISYFHWSVLFIDPVFLHYQFCSMIRFSSLISFSSFLHFSVSFINQFYSFFSL